VVWYNCVRDVEQESLFHVSTRNFPIEKMITEGVSNPKAPARLDFVHKIK
jgi:hypothetical protein